MATRLSSNMTDGRASALAAIIGAAVGTRSPLTLGEDALLALTALTGALTARSSGVSDDVGSAVVLALERTLDATVTNPEGEVCLGALEGPVEDVLGGLADAAVRGLVPGEEPIVYSGNTRGTHGAFLRISGLVTHGSPACRTMSLCSHSSTAPSLFRKRSEPQLSR
jgi:hypothetical protein